MTDEGRIASECVVWGWMRQIILLILYFFLCFRFIRCDRYDQKVIECWCWYLWEIKWKFKGVGNIGMPRKWKWGKALIEYLSGMSIKADIVCECENGNPEIGKYWVIAQEVMECCESMTGNQVIWIIGQTTTTSDVCMLGKLAINYSIRQILYLWLRAFRMPITKVIVILDEMIFKFLSLLSHYATGIIIKSKQLLPAFLEKWNMKNYNFFNYRPRYKKLFRVVTEKAKLNKKCISISHTFFINFQHELFWTFKFCFSSVRWLSDAGN